MNGIGNVWGITFHEGQRDEKKTLTDSTENLKPSLICTFFFGYRSFDMKILVVFRIMKIISREPFSSPLWDISLK